MTQPGNSSPPSGASAWVQTHKPQAAGAAAVVAVAGFALYRRAHPTAADAATAAAAVSPDVAGLSSPDTSATDIQNAVQGQINDALTAINGQLNKPAPPAPPAAPPPAPKPGAVIYKIVKKDTISIISNKVYGRNDLYTRNLIRAANPVLAGFTANLSLSYFAGNTIKIPAYHGSLDKAPANQPAPVPKS